MDLPFGTLTPDLDVLIVGAGLSGLASALKILSMESTLKVRIIESSGCLGGQLGQDSIRFVDAAQQDMLAFLTLIQMSPRRRRHDNSRLRRCWDLDRGFTALPAKFELGRYIEMLDLRMSKFRSKRFNLRERVSNMEQHICHHLFFNKSRNFMLNLVELVCGVPANEVDYDVFMSVCSSCGGLKKLIDFSQPLVSGHESRPSTFCGYILHSPEDQDEVLGDVMGLLEDHFGEEMRKPLETQFSTDELNVALHKPQTKPWYRVIWSSSSAVGTNYRSLMGGAVQSGFRAAVNALFVVRPQVVSWKDMLDERPKNLQESFRTGRLRGLLSRLNLYNVTFYSLFVLGLIWLLNFGYARAS